VFHTIARALLCEDEPAPALTATVEASVWCVFQHVRDLLEVEIEDPLEERRQPSWRQLVLAASRETQVTDHLPDENSTEKADWEFLIDCLEGRVLWDYDWQLEDSVDLAPDASQRLKDELGIADDYFVTVPPDPSDAEAERLLQQLIELTDAARGS